VTRTTVVLAVGFLLGACGSPSYVTTPRPSPGLGDAEFVAVVRPFGVEDSTGRDLELAFLGGFNLPRPQLADIDGDGDLDLLLQEYAGRMLSFVREGTADSLPRFVLDSWRYLDLDVGEWSRLVDMDGDGDLDLLSEQPFSYISYRRNDGTRTQPRYLMASDTLRDDTGDPIFSDRQNIPQVGDLDCDGRPDLLIGRISGTILRYEAATASAPVPVFQLLTERFQDLEIITGQGGMHGANTMAFVDYDEDGDPDLFWGDFFEAGLLLFENTGSCASPEFRNTPVRFPREQPLITSGYNAPTFGDVDGDGHLDLVVGVIGGSSDPNTTTIANLHYLEQDASRRFNHQTSQLLPMVDVGSESMPVLIDLDGDGDLDLLLANKIEPSNRRTSRIYLFENVGTVGEAAFRMRSPLPMSGRYHFAPAFGDLDGDGDLDMLLGGWGATVSYLRNDGEAAVAVWAPMDSAYLTITRGTNTTPALGDIDGDGDLDLLVGEASGSLNFYRNEGTPRTPKLVLVSDTWEDIDVGRRSAPTLADIDGDGDLDLLIGSDEGGLFLYRNHGTRTTPRFERDMTWALDVPQISAPAMGDLDGDGDLDLVVGNVGGGVRYFENRQR
jgi:hypothetical protein